MNDDADDRSGLLALRMHAQGEHAKRLWIEAPGSAFWPVRITKEMLDEGRHFARMEGRFVFKHAVTRMPEVLRETLDAAGTKLDDIDLFLFHQANLRINEFVASSLGIAPEKCPSNIERYGNCSAASIPMLLDEAVREWTAAPRSARGDDRLRLGLHLGDRGRSLVTRSGADRAARVRSSPGEAPRSRTAKQSQIRTGYMSTCRSP